MCRFGLPFVLACTVCFVGFTPVAGCESGEFEGAPRAEAPEEPISANARRPARRGASQKKKGRLPPSHPPIGSDNARSGGAPENQGAGSRGSGGGAPMGGGGGPSREDLPVEWEVPEAWSESEPSSSMRVAEYRLPGRDGADAGTMAVFYFGSDAGGSVQANIDRWIGQFEVSGDASANERAEVRQKEVDGMKIHTVELTGTYDPGMGMGGSGGAKEGQRLRGIIVESPEGPVFFKAVGPEATIEGHDDAFGALVGSLSTETGE